jgi:SAM-dependent methyltransferase
MNPLFEIHMRPILGGLLSLIPGAFSLWDKIRPMGDPRPPEFGRNVWNERVADVRQAGLNPSLGTVLELGPGRSLSTLISALLDGSRFAIGVDTVAYASRDENLRVFDALAEQCSLPATQRESLRQKVALAGVPSAQSELKYFAPWTDVTVAPSDSVDFIFSISVLEHVVDPAAIYRACFAWLKPGGVMAHKIDFSCHGITKHWNGHYWLPDSIWALIRGHRTYAINRWTLEQHLQTLRDIGFIIVNVNNVVSMDNALFPADTPPAERFSTLPPESLLIKTCVLVLQKPSNAQPCHND